MKKKLQFSRRQMLAFVSASLTLDPLTALAETGMSDIYVAKNAQCGCCDSWIKIISENGFNVTSENLSRDLLAKFKIESGIPKEMTSCHTAIIMGFFIEGHVPAEDIKRLINRRPNALGLAVPGMPYGSPGMGSEAEREAYDVFLIRKDGTSEIFQHYPKGGLLV